MEEWKIAGPLAGMNFFASLETGKKIDLVRLYQNYKKDENINWSEYLVPMDSVENCGAQFDRPVERLPMDTVSIITTRLVVTLPFHIA